MALVNEGVTRSERGIKDLLCYRKLVRTSVAGPFVVPSLSRYDEKVGASGTEQHCWVPNGTVKERRAGNLG